MRQDSCAIAGREIGATGFGLLGFTWRYDPSTSYPNDDKAFTAMKTALEHGANFWNTGDFYGDTPTDRFANLKLIRRYFDKYPEDADKVFLSVKGGNDPVALQPDGTAESIARTIENTKNILGKSKRLDMFTLSRVGKVPIEESVKAIDEHIKKGDINSYCLSETAASTIRRAHKIRPVDAIEIEVSLWSREAEFNGVMATCKELGIPVIAYSPVGRGLLSGRYKCRDDLPVGLKLLDRVQENVWDANMRVVAKTKEIADRNGCTPAQVALSWLRMLSDDAEHPVIVPIPGSTSAARVAENSTHVNLQASDFEELQAFLESYSPIGGRYFGDLEKHLYQ